MTGGGGRSTFAWVQQRLADNKRFAPRNNKLPPNLLQGLAACAGCGYSSYRTSTRTTNKKIYYHRCLGSDDYRYGSGRIKLAVYVDRSACCTSVTMVLARGSNRRTVSTRRLKNWQLDHPL